MLCLLAKYLSQNVCINDTPRNRMCLYKWITFGIDLIQNGCDS